MSKTGFIGLLGIIIALMPFLGFPQSWDTAIFVASGLAIALFAFWVGREMKRGAHCDVLQHGKATDAYVESGRIRYEGTSHEHNTEQPAVQ